MAYEKCTAVTAQPDPPGTMCYFTGNYTEENVLKNQANSITFLKIM